MKHKHPFTPFFAYKVPFAPRSYYSEHLFFFQEEVVGKRQVGRMLFLLLVAEEISTHSNLLLHSLPVQ